LIDAGICVRNHDFTALCRVKSLRQRGFPYHSAPQDPQKPDALPPSRRKLPEVRRNKRNGARPRRAMRPKPFN
jgi:hypothetical protein